ncbi:type VI secretion system baseplate subunit TssG [Fibrella aquatica]|uniref:type VI secretion system baseplate subunit TssG n=1 Tax=Fibrella aquatica TaxID=3242487 RepID=UPI003520DAFE
MNKPLATDIRAEVWLARQLAEPTQANVVVRHLGTFARPYSPDLVAIDDVTEQPGQPDTRYVDLSREGFYDMLPEALFHPPRPANARPEAPTALSKRLREEEKKGRQFWLPAEQEMMRLRVRIEQQEQQTLEQATGPVWQEVFDWLLSIRGYSFSAQQQICLLAIWMNAHRVVGNWPETAAYFSRFLQVPVQITHGPRQANEPATQSITAISPGQSPRLGVSRVGIDWILPPSQGITDDGGVIRLTIGPLTPKQLADYLPNQIGWRYVSLLAGYLLPADADYQVVPVPKGNEACFTLADSATAGRLGLTTELPHSNATRL